MKHHPEQLEDEIYMGNSSPENAVKSSWRTGRLGTLTLNAKGEPCDRFTAEAIKPWFIKVSEVEASIENERHANKPWSAERIRTLQPMIDTCTGFVGGGGAEHGDEKGAQQSGAGSASNLVSNIGALPDARKTET